MRRPLLIGLDLKMGGSLRGVKKVFEFCREVAIERKN